MNKIKGILLLRFCLRIAIIISLAGCVSDAPRDNPLDPASSLYIADAVVKGRVVLKNQTNVGVSSAFIKELQSGESTLTDSLGYFTFLKLSTGSKSIVIEKDGFVSDTVRFVIEAGKQITVQSSLIVAYAIVNGRVVHKNQTNVGVSSVLIKEILTGEATITDSLGYFTFSKFSSGNKSLSIKKYGFVTDTLNIIVEAGKQITVQSFLNAIPTVSNATVLTRKIAQYSQSNVYYASISASVADADAPGIGDIDSVWLSIDTLTTFPMEYSTDKIFHYTLYQNQLLSNNLQSLVGKPMKIVVRDAGKAYGESAPFFISRIIEEEPKPLYPVSIPSVDTTGLFPNFVWNEPKVNFNFSYTISLTRLLDGKVVWIKSNIASFILSFHYDGTELLPGNYSWTISIVDEFGNYSTSKEATFIAK